MELPRERQDFVTQLLDQGSTCIVSDGVILERFIVGEDLLVLGLADSRHLCWLVHRHRPIVVVYVSWPLIVLEVLHLLPCLLVCGRRLVREHEVSARRRVPSPARGHIGEHIFLVDPHHSYLVSLMFHLAH